MRYKMILSYDGGGFGGWQKQKSGPPTVQGTLEKILAQILRTPTRVIGAGRTDAGVHAVAQVAHFDSERKLDHSFHRSVNALAPDGLVIKSVHEVPDDFHAIASAIGKTYVYRVWNSPLPSVFQRHWSLWIPKPIDLEKLNELSSLFIRTQDFKSFQTKGTDVSTTIRTVTEARWRTLSSHGIEFRISGEGFLKQMVRNIVGTLLYLERKKLGKPDLEAILRASDRQAAKATAPPHGLYLLHVKYPSRFSYQGRRDS